MDLSYAAAVRLGVDRTGTAAGAARGGGPRCGAVALAAVAAARPQP
jgi:rare lipoprotein A (peptidoglycan hydrolase)